jgi:hypothetical protein
MQAQRVTLELTDDEAFVLYDWLTRFHQRDMTDVADQAEERVLFDLEARLEKVLLALVQADYATRVAQARATGRAACP